MEMVDDTRKRKSADQIAENQIEISDPSSKKPKIDEEIEIKPEFEEEINQKIIDDTRVSNDTNPNPNEEAEEPVKKSAAEIPNPDEEEKSRNPSSDSQNPSTDVQNQGGEEANKITREEAKKLLEGFSKDQLVEILGNAVVKDEETFETVRKIADKDPVKRKLFVRGLGLETTSETLGQVFSLSGDVEEAVVIMDRNTKKSKGFGFVTFRHIDGAVKALRKPSKQIDGRMCVCKPSGQDTEQTAAPDAIGRKIYVRNVPQNMPAGKLLEFFSSFGEVEEGPLGYDRVSGKSRGYAIFVYKSLDSAKKVLAEPSKSLEGNVLECKPAEENFNKSRPPIAPTPAPAMQKSSNYEGSGGFQNPRYGGNGAGHGGNHPSHVPAAHNVGAASGHNLAGATGHGLTGGGFHNKAMGNQGGGYVNAEGGSQYGSARAGGFGGASAPAAFEGAGHGSFHGSDGFPQHFEDAARVPAFSQHQQPQHAYPAHSTHPQQQIPQHHGYQNQVPAPYQNQVPAPYQNQVPAAFQALPHNAAGHGGGPGYPGVNPYYHG